MSNINDDIKLATAQLQEATNRADGVTKFIDDVASGGEDTEVPNPQRPGETTPSIQKFLKIKAEQFKHEFKTFDNGGPWTPTPGNEYPDVSAVNTHMTYQINIGRDASFEFTTSDLTGEIVFAGDDLNYDFEKNTWSLIKNGTAGNRLVILPTPDNYQTIRVNQGNVFHLKLNAPVCELVFSGVDSLEAGFNQIILILEQTVGAGKITWPSNIEWAYNRPPVLSYEAGKQDMVTLFKMYNANKWYGVFSGGWFNV